MVCRGCGRDRQRPGIVGVHAAGVELHAKPGDHVVKGQPLATLHTSDAARFPRACEALEGSLVIGDEAPQLRPIVLDRIV